MLYREISHSSFKPVPASGSPRRGPEFQPFFRQGRRHQVRKAVRSAGEDRDVHLRERGGILRVSADRGFFLPCAAGVEPLRK